MWRLNDLFGVNNAHQAEMLSCFAFDHLEAIAAGNAERLVANRALFNDFVSQRDVDCMPAGTASPCSRAGQWRYRAAACAGPSKI